MCAVHTCLAELSAQPRGLVSVELLLLPDARLQSSNHHVRTAREGVPQRRRVQGEQMEHTITNPFQKQETFPSLVFKVLLLQTIASKDS